MSIVCVESVRHSSSSDDRIWVTLADGHTEEAISRGPPYNFCHKIFPLWSLARRYSDRPSTCIDKLLMGIIVIIIKIIIQGVVSPCLSRQSPQQHFLYQGLAKMLGLRFHGFSKVHRLW